MGLRGGDEGAGLRALLLIVIVLLAASRAPALSEGDGLLLVAAVGALAVLGSIALLLYDIYKRLTSPGTARFEAVLAVGGGIIGLVSLSVWAQALAHH